MPENAASGKTEKENPPQPVLIFRGVGKAHNRSRLGAWWTTDPYYALMKSEDGAGDFFVASVDPDLLAELSEDASTDAEYENYLFPGQDPPEVRRATTEELEALRAARPPAPEDIANEYMVMHPDNAVEIGITIFGPKNVNPDT